MIGSEINHCRRKAKFKILKSKKGISNLIQNHIYEHHLPWVRLNFKNGTQSNMQSACTA